MIIFLLTIFIISIVLLIPTILIQTSGADNGVMSNNITAGAFGARSNEILVKFTGYCVATFICSALLLSIYYIRLSETTYTEETIPTETVEGTLQSETLPALPIEE